MVSSESELPLVSSTSEELEVSEALLVLSSSLDDSSASELELVCVGVVEEEVLLLDVAVV